MTTLTDTQVITASGGLVELGYSQITSTVAIDNATGGTGKEVIPPLTVVCDGNPILIEFYSPNVHAANTVDDHIYVSLFMDGAEYTRNWGWHSSPAATYNRRAMLLQRRITPSAGSHTFSVRAYVTNASRIGYVAAGSGGSGSGSSGDAPAFLRVSKIVQATQWPAVTTGTIICTSSTRPASPFEGQTIWEGDTDRTYVWNGAAWVSPSVSYKPPACEVYRSSNATSYSSSSAISWSAAHYDTDTTPMWSSGDPTKITIRTSGLYLLKFYCYLTASATLSMANLQFRINNSYDFGISGFPANTSTTLFGMLSDVFPLTAGDYITAAANIYGGSAYAINGNATRAFNQSRFSATLIGQTS